MHAQSLSDLLSCRKGLERHAVPLAAALFQNNQNTHSTRASNLSFSTSWCAACFGSPEKICACLLRCGKYTRSVTVPDVRSTPSCGAGMIFTSFVFAFLIPISVAYRSFLIPD